MNPYKLSFYFFLLFSIIFLFPLDAGEETYPKALILYKARDKDFKATIDYLSKFIIDAGFKWDAMDVEKLLALKSEPDLSGYKGIITCYLSNEMKGAHLYPRFLIRQMQAEKKILIIGSYGAYQGLIPKRGRKDIKWNESTLDINTFFWPFGLEFLYGWTGSPEKLKITRKDPSMVEYQAKLKQEDLKYYQYYKSVNRDNKVYLEVERTDLLDSKSAFVVHTPFGGMVLESYGYFWDSKTSRIYQRVDLTRFIREGLQGIPPEVPMYKLKTHKQLIEENPLPELPVSRNIQYTDSHVNRHLLVVYKKSETPALEEHPVFNRAGIVLNYSGYILDYSAVEDGLPSEREMEKYRGIITWHTSQFMYQARQYNNWMLKQIQNGKKVIIIENYGAYIDETTQMEVTNVDKVFAALGIKHSKLALSRVEYFPQIIKLDNEMLGFEHAGGNDYFEYWYKYTSSDPESKIYLSLDDYYSDRIDLVFTNSHGGFAFGNSAYYFPYRDAERVKLVRDALAGKVQPEIAEFPTLGNWIVNPYIFFKAASGTDNFPVPDYTTLSGSRIFYIHIDGDGLNSISLIDGTNYAGKYILEKHIRHYNDLPFSASVISIQMEQEGNVFYNPLLELAREIYSLPNIEIATHTATHPFNWVKGDPYIVNPGHFPWQLSYQPQDYIYEIWGSKLFINNNLAPPGKECKIVFWSGECNPDEEALKVAEAAGLKNLNGGDPIFDSEHPSLTGLCPLSISYGVLRQYYTSARNDYLYTLFLTGDWGGQEKLIDHFEKTESPLRILPMNFYYHYFSGIKNASLNAGITVLDYFRKGNFTGVFASEYVQIVEDFYNTSIQKIGNAFYIENNGFLRTLRFPAYIFPDMEKSRGVIGFLHHNGQTYIHLDGQKKYKLIVSNKKIETPYLRQATFKTGVFSINDDELTLNTHGFGRAYFSFGGFKVNSSYHITMVNNQNQIVVHEKSVTDHSGIVSFTTLLPGPPQAYTISLKMEDMNTR